MLLYLVVRYKMLIFVENNKTYTMSSIIEIEKLANELLNTSFEIKGDYKNHLINPKELGYTFKWDTAKRRFGCCNYTQLKITLSKSLCLLNLNKTHTKIKDTILHEIAHAISFDVFGYEGRGHGDRWVSVAKQIGCDGKRCYDSKSIEKPTSKYTLTCPTCGREAKRHRIPKKNVSCGNCSGGVYNSKHKFIVEQNY